MSSTTPALSALVYSTVTNGFALPALPSGWIDTALAWRKSTLVLAYSSARSKVTSFSVIWPTPTQMLEGIQFHLALGDTTTISCCFPIHLLRYLAAVCPDIPAPRITIRDISSLSVFPQIQTGN